MPQPSAAKFRENLHVVSPWGSTRRPIYPLQNQWLARVSCGLRVNERRHRIAQHVRMSAANETERVSYLYYAHIA
jgi:hypothetical protein